MEEVYQVIISHTARASLRNIVEYIYEESPQAAQNVRKELFSLVESLANNPERYSPEPFLAHKPGTYRSASKWDYKITDQKVLVLDIVHMHQHLSRIEKLE